MPRSVPVILPGGLTDGQRLAVEGQGQFDPSSREFGRVVLACWSSPMDGLRVEDGILVATVEVPADQAEAGGRFTVPTPDGPLLVDLPGPAWEGRQYLISRRGERTDDGERAPLPVRVKLSRPARRSSSAGEQASAAELVGRARQAVKNDDVSGAVSLCTQALALDERFPMAHAVLGVALSKRDQSADAIREIRTAVRLDHRSERFWFYLGCTYNTAKMPVPAAAAAYAGMLRDRHSTRLVRLWNEALRQVLASDPTCGELSAADLGGFEAIRRDLQRQYVGAATTALAEVVGQHPGCARLHYQRGAALWFLSVQGLEAHLGAACSCVARAVALVDMTGRVNEALRDNVLDGDLLEQAPALYAFIQAQVPDTVALDLARQEYAATLGELLETVRREGAVSDMVAAATALVSHDRHDEAVQLLLASVDRILAGALTGWYQQKAAELRGEPSPELSTERSAAEASRSLDLCLGLVWQRQDQLDHSAADLRALAQASQPLLGRAAEDLRALRVRAVTASTRAFCREVDAVVDRLSRAITRDMAALCISWQSTAAGSPTMVGLAADGLALSGRLSARRGGHGADPVSLSGEDLTRYIDERLADTQAVSAWLEKSSRILGGVEAHLRKAYAAATLAHVLFERRFGPEDARSDVRSLVRAIQGLHTALHANVDDAETRELLSRALEEFRQLSEPFLAVDLGARADLFQNTLDAIRTKAAGEHAFAASEEELLAADKLALFDWAAEALTAQQPPFPQEFMLAAKRDCYALTSHRLVHREPGTTILLSIPLPRIAAYEQRAAGFASVTVVMDLHDGTRVTLGGLPTKDAAPKELMNWVLGARMWQNLSDDQVALLDSGRKVDIVPRPAVALTHELPAAPAGPVALSAASRPLCPSCSSPVLEGDRFCRECGQRVALAALPADEEATALEGGSAQELAEPNQE